MDYPKQSTQATDTTLNSWNVLDSRTLHHSTSILGANIRRLMNHRNLKEADLARQVNLPQTTVNRILTQERSDPRLNTIIPIANYLGVTLGQLVGLEPIQDSHFYSGSNREPSTLKTIPLITWGHLSLWVYNSEHMDQNLVKSWLCTERRIGPKAFALESMPFMEPRFQLGSKLIVDPSASALDGSYIVVILQGGTPTVRRILNDGPEAYLKAFDNNMPAIKLESHHKVIGPIIEVRQAFC